MTQSKSEGVNQEGSTTRTEAPASKPIALNQCDGCRRKLPLDGKIHVGVGYDTIYCTRDLYE